MDCAFETASRSAALIGQNGESAGQAVDAGADAIVAGSAIFKSHDYAAAILNLRQSAMRRA
jgi:pentose-5-phosphate-3-epimerase